jgi:hypothetical protein
MVGALLHLVNEPLCTKYCLYILHHVTMVARKHTCAILHQQDRLDIWWGESLLSKSTCGVLAELDNLMGDLFLVLDVKFEVLWLVLINARLVWIFLIPKD